MTIDTFYIDRGHQQEQHFSTMNLLPSDIIRDKPMAIWNCIRIFFPSAKDSPPTGIVIDGGEKIMHPFLKEGVELGSFTNPEDEAIPHYYAVNPKGEEFEIDKAVYEALLHADGTAPLPLSDKFVSLLEEECGLIQTSRCVKMGGLSWRLILFSFHKQSQKAYRSFCIAVNRFLTIAAPLIFGLGCFLRMTNYYSSADDYSLLWYYVLLIISVFAHEFGHLSAGIAYGYPMQEMGVLFFGIVPVGAYVAHRDHPDTDVKKGQYVQFCLAGIEMNLLLAGLFIILSIINSPFSTVLLLAAHLNIILALMNLIPARGLDGEAALSSVLEVESINKTARDGLFNRASRQKLMKSGVKGFFCLFTYAVLLSADAAIWVIALLDLFCIAIYFLPLM